MPLIEQRKQHPEAEGREHARRLAKALQAPARDDQRRRMLRAGAGVATVVVAAGAVLALWSTTQHRTEVLVLAQPVVFGQVITAADVRTVDAEAMPGIAVLPRSDLKQVVGRTVLDSLPAGTPLSGLLLGSSSLTSGQDVVSLLVKEGNYPPMNVGDQVAVEDAGSPSVAPTASSAAPSSSGSSLRARVLGVRPASDAVGGAGSVVVTLSVADPDALQAATWSTPVIVGLSDASAAVPAGR